VRSPFTCMVTAESFDPLRPETGRGPEESS